jgi:hypothetical protein
MLIFFLLTTLKKYSPPQNSDKRIVNKLDIVFILKYDEAIREGGVGDGWLFI